MNDAPKKRLLQSFGALARRCRGRKTYRGSATALFLYEKEHIVAFTASQNCCAGEPNLTRQLTDNAQQCRRLQKFLEDKRPLAKEFWSRETYACKALTNVRALYFYIPTQVLRYVVEGKHWTRRRRKRKQESVCFK